MFRGPCFQGPCLGVWVPGARVPGARVPGALYFQGLGFKSLYSGAQGKGAAPGWSRAGPSEIRLFSTGGTGGVEKMSMAPLITKRRPDQGHTNQRGLAP